MLEAAFQEAGVGLDRPDLDLAGRLGQTRRRRLARVLMDDQLGDHRVIELADLAALLHAGVDADAVRHDEMLQLADGGQEAVGRILGIQPRLHGPAVQLDLGLLQRDRLARGNAELPFDQIDARHALGHGMLDLQPGVHLHEPDAVRLQPVRGVGDELDRPGPDVVHGLGRLDRGPGHGGAHGIAHARRRRLLDHLLVAALQRTVALIQMDDLAVPVAKHLHLDMARTGNIAFDQHPVVTERRSPLALGAGQTGGEIGRIIDPFHTLAAAARDRLDQHRIADPRRLGRQGLFRLVRALIAGRHRHPGLDHQLLGRVLQTHGANRGRVRPDPDQARRRDGLGEVGVLAQEAISGVDRLCAGRLGRSQHLGAVQIRFARRRRTDQHRLVGFAHMQGVGVRLGIDGDGANPHPLGGAEDTAGDFAAIGDKDGLEHEAVLAGSCASGERQSTTLLTRRGRR